MWIRTVATAIMHPPRLVGSFSALRAAPLAISRMAGWRPAVVVGSTTRLYGATPLGALARKSAASDASHLIKLIDREYQEEVEKVGHPPAMPDDLQQLQGSVESAGWTIKDSSTSAVVQMQRNIGKGLATISFHCQDTVEGLEYGQDEEDEADEPAAAVRFTVTVTSSSSGPSPILYFQCTSELSGVRIENVAMTHGQDQSLEELHSGQATFASQFYQGPVFDELPEDLQDEFHSYLGQVVGINEDVATLVAMYCDYKEETQYVAFLKGAKELLESS
jgi:Mitochondrial glycoprotein